MRARAGLWARLAASAALVALLLWKVDAAAVGRQLASASAAGVALVVLLHTADRLLMAVKWRGLLVARGLDPGLGEAVRAYYVSSFAGVFLPMTVGADLVRVGALRRAHVATRHVVASIALERLLGALAQALFCLVSVGLLVALRLRLRLPVGTLALAAALLLVAATLALPLSFRLATALAAAWSEADGLRGRLAELAHTYAAWRDQPAALRRFFLLTLLEGLLPITTYAAAAWALGVPVAWLQLVALVPLVYLLARLPVSVAGIGVEQGSYTAAAAALFGQPEAAAAAVSFLVSPIALLVALTPGALAWLWRRDHR